MSSIENFSSSKCNLTIANFQTQPSVFLYEGGCRCGQPIHLHPQGFVHEQTKASELTPTEKLRMFLPKSKKVDPKILDIISKEYSARLLTVENETLAIELYSTAERTMRSTTRNFLRTSLDFIVDGVFPGAMSSKASFYKAFDEGRPVVVKVYEDSKQADKEHDTVLAIKERRGVSDLASLNLVPVASVPIRLRDQNNLLKTHSISALTMPMYAATAREFPTPVPEQHVVRIGSDVLHALEHIWACGLSFCDTKPDNIFLSADGRASLGDYGGVTPFGETPAETTPAYIPTDLLEADVAGDVLDRWMLIITLLELSTKTLVLPISRAAAVQKINQTGEKTQAFIRHAGNGLF